MALTFNSERVRVGRCLESILGENTPFCDSHRIMPILFPTLWNILSYNSPPYLGINNTKRSINT